MNLIISISVLKFYSINILKWKRPVVAYYIIKVKKIDDMQKSKLLKELYNKKKQENSNIQKEEDEINEYEILY